MAQLDSGPEPGAIRIDDPRSGCPISLVSELLGDRWSLVVIRDLMFTDRTGFRELLAGSDEGIASNILSARLAKLVAAGLLTRHDDPAHRQKVHYRLTEPAIQLVPVFVEIGRWASTFLPVDPEAAASGRQLAEGGRAAVEVFMDELRGRHLGDPPGGGATVSTRGLDR